MPVNDKNYNKLLKFGFDKFSVTYIYIYIYIYIYQTKYSGQVYILHLLLYFNSTIKFKSFNKVKIGQHKRVMHYLYGLYNIISEYIKLLCERISFKLLFWYGVLILLKTCLVIVCHSSDPRLYIQHRKHFVCEVVVY